MIEGAIPLDEAARMRRRSNGHGSRDDDGEGASNALTVYRAEDVVLNLNTPYYVKGLIGPRQIIAVYGGPGTGKTFFVLWLLWLISVGQSLLGRRVCAARALFLAMEPGQIEWRISAAAATYGPSADFYWSTDSVNLFVDPGAADKLIATIERDRIGILAIDTLIDLVAGADENSVADLSRAFEILRKVIAKTGVTIVLIHHPGKNKDLGMRGSSFILGKCDAVLGITEAETGLRTVAVEKLRDGRKFDFTFRLASYLLGVDADEDRCETFIVETDDGAQTTKTVVKKTLTAKQKTYFDAIRNLIENGDHTEDHTVSSVRSHANGPRVTAVRREEVRKHLQQCGLIDGEPDEPSSAKNRGKLRDILVPLQGNGYLHATKELVWLL